MKDRERSGKQRLAFCACLLACVTCAAQEREDARIDFADRVGRFKPVHGVNNGPYSLSSVTERLRRFHKEAGFPFVRLHDVPLGYCAPYAVDISAVFPCADADPDDPKNYTFAKTDAVIAAIVTNGAQVIYRLGQSIEHREKYHTNPPKDFHKWARVCVNIVRHYNEGWADGFRYGIKRWEIWNEPDIQPCWTGTDQQFFDLYVAAAKALKAHDASLMIGGPAVTSPHSRVVKPFLAYCRDQKAPLDFFSWHAYGRKPDEIISAAKQAQKVLDEAGFTQAESYCTEWREMRDWAWRRWADTKNGAADIDALWAELNGPQGMVFCAAVMMKLQDTSIDIANFYTGDSLLRWGMFDQHGYPHKIYQAFPAYGELYKVGNRVKAETKLESALMEAGVSDDGRHAALMIVSQAALGCDTRTVNVSLLNLPWKGAVRVEVLRADGQYDLEKVDGQTLAAGQTVLKVPLPCRSIIVVKLGEAGK